MHRALDLSGVAAGSMGAAMEVALKICRGGRVQKVAIKVAQDHGLGTRRLVHWCGAQFQVRASFPYHTSCLTCSRSVEHAQALCVLLASVSHPCAYCIRS